MRIVLALVFVAALASPARAAVVDSFDDASQWKPLPADGVGMSLSNAPGETGRALRFDFRFTGGGYAVARRELSLDLPENYRFAFRIRGPAPPNHVEFKLVDSTGANVWWHVKRDFAFPSDWQTVAIKKRQISFAWGPAGGGDLRRVAAIEIAITASSGGEGTVYFDELTLEPLPPPSAAPPPLTATASSTDRRNAAANALDRDSTTAWRPAGRDRNPSLTLDLGALREFGGLRLEWLPDHAAHDYDVQAQDERGEWRTIREVRGGDGRLDLLHLPESEARRLRIRILRGSGRGVALRTARVLPIEWAPTVNDYFIELAKEYPRGWFPRGFSGEQSYWTVIGDSSESNESVLSEDGAFEFFESGFSIEPLLRIGDEWITWADARIEHELTGPGIFVGGGGIITGPITTPIVKWSAREIELRITAMARGKGRVLKYHLRNPSERQIPFELYAWIRPFQAYPPTQFLNTTGGVTNLRTVSLVGNKATIDDSVEVFLSAQPEGFDAWGLDQWQGDGVPLNAPAKAGAESRVLAWRNSSTGNDPQNRLSAVLIWKGTLEPDSSTSYRLSWNVPLLDGEALLTDSEAKPVLRLPSGSELDMALDLQLHYILVNRDGAAIQPGSRAYERSWIRDGAMTSSALLRLGREDVVRDYLNWFAQFQYENGKVPCCVDARGADPVPEHDSGGEFLFLLAEYLRYTNDQATLDRLWPSIVRAVAYLDTLRQQRRTPEWRTRENAHFFGLLPPSISHEGYSAKPMHSYWDDFWALRGFRDAKYLADALGHPAEADRFERIAREFGKDLERSIAASMAKHRIDYVPGAADLGDFDATSTTIVFNPVQGREVTPPGALERTFERYWKFFVQRRDGTEKWDAYTPYEIRNIGAFVHLGWRDRAQELLDFFMTDRRPVGWQQWPEVIRRNPREPGFLGDLPHTWVGSDFIRSILDMFAFDDESQKALVLGAGIPEKWLTEGTSLGVHDLRTPYGSLSYTVTRRNRAYEVDITSRLRHPIERVIVRLPGVEQGWRVRGGGSKVAAPDRRGDVVVKYGPARFTLEPAR